MALDFDKRGLLPEGVHPCTESEFDELLVRRFPSASTRSTIRDGFFALRAKAEEHGVAGVQWIDGSYVSTKRDPTDVDVVTFVDIDLLNRLTEDAKLFVRDVLAEGKAKASFRTDAYVAAVAHPGHPAYSACEKWRQYWRDWFGHFRPLPNPAGGSPIRVKKGILKMGLGNPDEQPTVSEEVDSHVIQ